MRQRGIITVLQTLNKLSLNMIQHSEMTFLYLNITGSRFHRTVVNLPVGQYCCGFIILHLKFKPLFLRLKQQNFRLVIVYILH